MGCGVQYKMSAMFCLMMWRQKLLKDSNFISYLMVPAEQFEIQEVETCLEEKYALAT